MGKSRRMPLHAPATATPGPASYHAQRASDEHAAGPAFSMPRAPRLRAPAPETIGPGRYDVIPSATASPSLDRPVASRPSQLARLVWRGQTRAGIRPACSAVVARCPLHGRLSLVASPPHIVRPPKRSRPLPCVGAAAGRERRCDRRLRVRPRHARPHRAVRRARPRRVRGPPLACRIAAHIGANRTVRLTALRATLRRTTDAV